MKIRLTCEQIHRGLVNSATFKVETEGGGAVCGTVTLPIGANMAYQVGEPFDVELIEPSTVPAPEPTKGQIRPGVRVDDGGTGAEG